MTDEEIIGSWKRGLTKFQVAEEYKKSFNKKQIIAIFIKVKAKKNGEQRSGKEYYILEILEILEVQNVK